MPSSKTELIQFYKNARYCSRFSVEILFVNIKVRMSEQEDKVYVGIVDLGEVEHPEYVDSQQRHSRLVESSATAARMMICQAIELEVQEGPDSEEVKFLRERARQEFGKVVELTISEARATAFIFLGKTSAMGSRILSEEVDDLVQDAYMRAFKHLHKFKGDSEFRTWLYAIIRNQSKNVFRREHRHFRDRLRPAQDDSDGSSDESYLPASEFMEDYTIDGLARDEIVDIIQGMQTRYREIIVLRGIYDLRYTQIIKLLGLEGDNKAESRLKVRFFRAVREVKKELEKRGINAADYFEGR